MNFLKSARYDYLFFGFVETLELQFFFNRLPAAGCRLIAAGKGFLLVLIIYSKRGVLAALLITVNW